MEFYPWPCSAVQTLRKIHLDIAMCLCVGFAFGFREGTSWIEGVRGSEGFFVTLLVVFVCWFPIQTWFPSTGGLDLDLTLALGPGGLGPFCKTYAWASKQEGVGPSYSPKEQSSEEQLRSRF